MGTALWNKGNARLSTGEKEATDLGKEVTPYNLTLSDLFKGSAFGVNSDEEDQAPKPGDTLGNDDFPGVGTVFWYAVTHILMA